MQNLANYYYKNDDYDQMKKYHLMAIEKGESSTSMFWLGLFYEKNKEYENMKKYLLMALNYGCTKSFNKLLSYHEIYNFEDKYLLRILNKNMPYIEEINKFL